MNKPKSEVFNIDCMEYMATMPDKAFGLALVDPPYGIGVDGQKESICNNPKHNRKEHAFKGWDTSIPSKEYFLELERVSANRIIWGANYMVNHLKPSKGWIVWDKGQYGLTMSDCELAYSSFNVPTRVFKMNRSRIAKFGGSIHPTQKPVELYSWLLNNYAKEGDKILDTHLGSGSSRIAAHKLGFEFVGCELDKDYFEAQEKRFKKECLNTQILSNGVEVVQTSLF